MTSLEHTITDRERLFSSTVYSRDPSPYLDRRGRHYIRCSDKHDARLLHAKMASQAKHTQATTIEAFGMSHGFPADASNN